MKNLDPTRTVTLRRVFQTAMSKRFMLLKKRLKELILSEHALGVTTNWNPWHDKRGQFTYGPSGGSSESGGYEPPSAGKLPSTSGEIYTEEGPVSYTVNPTNLQWETLLRRNHGVLRGLVDEDKVIVWPEVEWADHSDMKDALDVRGKAINFYVYREGGRISIYADKEYMTTQAKFHPYLSKRVQPPERPGAIPTLLINIENGDEKFASTQVNLGQGAIALRVAALQNSIAGDDLIKLETYPHVTIRYGLHGEDPKPVESLIAGSGPVWVRLGELSLFQNEKQDVLKISVESPQLERINRRLLLLPNTETHSGYKPHLTIAYLKPGTGIKYLGRKTGLEGLQLVLKGMVFSNKARKHTPIVLNTRWEYQTSMQKLDSFRKWLQEQMQLVIKANNWWQTYVEDGYRRGAKRALDDVMKGLPDIDKPIGPFYAGTQRDFMQGSFGRVVPVEKVQLLAQRVYTDIDGVTDFMEAGIIRSLTDGLVQGKGMNDIAQSMAETVDIGLNRAKGIARTAIIRSHAEGQLDGLEKLGVTQVGVTVEWSTAGDGHVCKLCRPLEGIILTTKEARGLIPRHPNCITGETRVVAPNPLAVMSAKYTGVIFDLTMAGGRVLSVTENHILLTQRGWVFAKHLTDSDHLVDSAILQSAGLPVVPDDYHRHPEIGEVFQSLVEVLDESRITKTLPMPEYLHGDGKSVDSEIEVVSTEGILWDQNYSAFRAHFMERFLSGRNSSISHAESLNSQGLLTAFLKRADSAATRLMCSLGITDVLLARSTLHHQPVSVGSTAYGDAFSFEDPSNCTSLKNQPLGDCLETDSARIELDDLLGGKLVKVESVSLRHVSDLQVYDVNTESSLYIAEGFLTSNCRCAYKPAGMIDRRGTQIRDKQKIEAALSKSLGHERKKTKRQWIGAGLKLAKKRPQPLVSVR